MAAREIKNTVFDHGDMQLADLNAGVESIIRKTVYPVGGTKLAADGSTDISGQTYEFNVVAPAGYFILPSECHFRAVYKAKRGDNAAGLPMDAAPVMGCPHSWWFNQTHTFGDTQLMNDNSPYDSAYMTYLRTFNASDDSAGYGYWKRARAQRQYNCAQGGAHAQPIAMRWQPANPWFAQSKAQWLGGGQHTFTMQGHTKWKQRSLDAAAACVIGGGAAQAAVQLTDLAMHVVFVKPGPEIMGKHLTPSLLNYEMDYASLVTIAQPQTVGALDTAPTFAIQASGSVYAAFCWLRSEVNGGSATGPTQNKPLHFADAHDDDARLTSIQLELDGISYPTQAYRLAFDPAADFQGEPAWADLMDALGSRDTSDGTPINLSNWYGRSDQDAGGNNVYGAATGGFTLFGFRLLHGPLDVVDMTRLQVRVERTVANAGSATQLYVALAQPASVLIDFDAELNLARVTKAVA